MKGDKKVRGGKNDVLKEREYMKLTDSSLTRLSLSSHWIKRPWPEKLTSRRALISHITSKLVHKYMKGRNVSRAGVPTHVFYPCAVLGGGMQMCKEKSGDRLTS